MSSQAVMLLYLKFFEVTQMALSTSQNFDTRQLTLNLNKVLRPSRTLIPPSNLHK